MLIHYWSPKYICFCTDHIEVLKKDIIKIPIFVIFMLKGHSALKFLQNILLLHWLVDYYTLISTVHSGLWKISIEWAMI